MITAPAPAKINLHLRVTGIRENGYHELDTSFVYVDVSDLLTIEPCDSLNVSCSIPELSGESNLVFRVLDALRQHHGIRQGANVHIRKNLPAQAGLGGGSSDAATALMVANRLWQLNLPMDELIAFATPFGADIPCFLFTQASLAEGIGEKLIPYPAAIPDDYLLLAHPGVGLSTPEVFRCFDRHTSLTPEMGVDTMRRLSRSANAAIPVGHNDLEPCACELSSEVERLLATMRALSERAWMSGSGSTCVAMFESLERAEEAALMLSNQELATWTHAGKLLREHPFSQQL